MSKDKMKDAAIEAMSVVSVFTVGAVVFGCLLSAVGCSTTSGIASRHVGTMSINAKAGNDVVINLRENNAEQAADKAVDALKAAATAAVAQGDADNSGSVAPVEAAQPAAETETNKPAE